MDGKLDHRKLFSDVHSLDGATSAQVALDHDRILGGLNFDGQLFGSVKEVGLDKPFFIVGEQTLENGTTYFGDFIEKVRGPKMLITIDGTKHLTFFDAPLLLSLRDNLPPELKPVIAAALGTIDGKRAASILDDILLAVTSFVFKRRAKSLCKIEDGIAEVVLMERDLKKPCK